MAELFLDSIDKMVMTMTAMTAMTIQIDFQKKSLDDLYCVYHSEMHRAMCKWLYSVINFL